MADITITQIEHLSQQLTNRFKKIDTLMTEARLEHELARDSLRALLVAYYKWLGKEGIPYIL